MTTYVDFITNLGDLEVAGVHTRLDEPPASIDSADLPAQWVQFPSGEEDAYTFTAHGGWPTFKAQLIIAYEAISLSTQAANWKGTIALMDDIADTLRAAVGTVAKGKIIWALRVGEVTVGEHKYWAIIAEVETYG